MWEEVSAYLERVLPALGGRGLELGCGWGDWIASMPFREKAAVEYNAVLADHARREHGIRVMEGDVFTLLPTMADGSTDAVLASNFFEHFDVDGVARLLREAKRVLAPGGSLIAIQPNFRYCATRYFDDYTHRSIHSHISFADLLASEGYTVERCEPRFLPFSFKSRLPVNRFLVRAFLRSPLRIGGAQFMISAKPNHPISR